MKKGVITIDYKGRLVDKIAKAMHKAKLFKTDGYYPIMEEATGKEVGRFVCVYGNGLIVRFLGWITDCRGKNVHQVTIKY